VANETLTGKYSFYKNRAPPAAADYVATPADATGILTSAAKNATMVELPKNENAKAILDSKGPQALAQWVVSQPQVLLTDTTFRDAHQSLVATRFRSVDLLGAAKLQSTLLNDLFSMECWGGATFDVCMRFLHEDPWERLRQIRAQVPNICLQMLLRGSNLVGYRNYPDNVVKAFVATAAKNGIDIFRIFDCFNDLEQMRVSIEAVREAGKVAEVCICYSGDLSSPDETIYTVEYYTELATRIAAAGAHFICIKDMAGLMKPRAASILIPAIRKAAPGVPVHYHTHTTSSLMLATCIAASDAGCDIVDFAIESMADQTSQPSLNAFCAAMAGSERDPGIDYLALQPLVRYWARIREMYRPFESGMLSGTARVFEHQIPGGQYSNLMVQCKSMGLWSQWDKVLDTYRDVNRMFGNIIKVTPSSKVVGDMSLYMINANLTVDDVVKRAETVAWPDSVIALCRGMLGSPHRGLPEEIVNMVLKSAGQERLTERPGASLTPADFDAAREEVLKLKSSSGASAAVNGQSVSVSDEEVLCHLIYDKVYADYCSFLGKNSAVTYLPSNVFWYGLAPGQSASFSLSRETAIANGLENVVLEGQNQDEVNLTLTLDRIEGIKQKDKRTLHFIVEGGGNKQMFNVTLTDENVGVSTKMVMADSSDETQIAAPLSGQVEFIASAGSTVQAGEALAIIVAMKMEVQVKAPFTLTVEALQVEKGEAAQEGCLLCRVNKK
jgi:pyruvate carboxylase